MLNSRPKQDDAWLIWPVGLLLLSGLCLFGSCDSAGEVVTDPQSTVPSQAASTGSAPVGSISMSLTLGGGFLIDSVSYDISGNGFHKVDTVRVATSTTLSAIAGGIPFGRGYQLRLTAKDSARRLAPCVGSASFDITSPTPIAVPVHLTCREIPMSVPVPRTASLVIAVLLLGLGTFLARRAA